MEILRRKLKGGTANSEETLGGKDSCLLLLPPCIFLQEESQHFSAPVKGMGSESPIDVTAETVGEVILPPLLNATACFHVDSRAE